MDSINSLYDQILTIRNSLPADKRSQLGQLLLPITQTLDAAIEKFPKKS
jgi:hypothetical protein